MKITSYLPEISGILQQHSDMSALMGNMELMKSTSRESYRSPTLGLDILYGAWVGQQMAYRQQLVAQIMEFARNVEEVRAPINHIIGEVFRRGIHWKPKFGSRCEQCLVEYTEDIEECEKCAKNSNGEDKGKMHKPDESQKNNFELFFDDCNIWDQSFQEVLQAAWFDVNSCLVPGTKVLTCNKNNIKMKFFNIEEIEVGDKVWTHRGRVRKVIKTYKRDIQEEIFVLHLVGNITIRITGEHPVFVKERGWVKTKDLQKEDILLKITEAHSTWSAKLHSRIPSVVDYDNRPVNIIKALKTKERRKTEGVEYHSNKGYTSPAKGKTLEEYLGAEKAIEITNKIQETKEKNESNKGVGFHFRAKVDNFNGSNNPNWKGGPASDWYPLVFNKELKRSIFERDNFTCQICGEYPVKRLQTHHIDYDKTNSDLRNLIALCKPCHGKTNGSRKSWETYLTNLMDEKLVGDMLVHNGTKILAITREHYEGPVYNLEVEEDNSYAGQGLIYHNCDDFFIHIVKEYKPMEDGTVRSKPIEIRRLNPALVEWDLDMQGIPKNSHYVCYIHRDTEVSSSPAKCPECDLAMVPVMYKYYYRGQTLYFLDSEIVHVSKFAPSETFGYSPILTLMHKILTIRGMDLNLYRYFYERKMPSAMVMVFTDDADSLRREREHIAARMRSDPNYIPMVAVSTKNSRGRVDMVRLFHTLQEMEYLPVREEIRERIAAMWGVTPAWQGSPDAFGGLSSQTQQLTVMSRVVEADQRIFHEKIFPQILKAFGITDWLLELSQPEEKAEATRISFAQQRISAANMLVQMGLTVKIKSTEVGIDDIDFSVSGQAVTPQQQQAMMSGGSPDSNSGGEPSFLPEGAMTPGENENSGRAPLQMSLIEKSPKMFMQQIQDSGYRFPIVKEVSSDLSTVIFDTISNGLYKASFNDGELLNIEKYVSPRMHKHKGQWTYHDINISHNNTMSRQQRGEDKLFSAEIPDSIEVEA